MLTDQDYERLSAYVDGELSQAEHTALETRLATDAELRAELEALRATIGLLAALPTRKAPRNFTLDARTARRPAPRVLFLPPAAFSALSAIAAMLLITLSALLYGGAQVAPMASSVAFAPTQAESLQREAEAQQPLPTQALTATPLSTEKQSMTASPALSEENVIMDAASSTSSEGTTDNIPSAAAPGQEVQSTVVMQFAAPDNNADMMGGAADAAASGMSAAAAPLQQAAATATALPTQPPPTPSPTPLPTQPAPTTVPSPAPVAQPDNTLPALLLLMVGLGLLTASITVGVRMGTRWR